MHSVQLKFADGKPTGFWYCGICRLIEGHKDNQHNESSSEWNKEEAERCCTGKAWRMDVCTGCKRYMKECICGRAQKNLCVACGSKLFKREGVKVQWGVAQAEICYACSQKPALRKKLMDARK